MNNMQTFIGICILILCAMSLAITCKIFHICSPCHNLVPSFRELPIKEGGMDGQTLVKLAKSLSRIDFSGGRGLLRMVVTGERKGVEVSPWKQKGACPLTLHTSVRVRQRPLLPVSLHFRLSRVSVRHRCHSDLPSEIMKRAFSLALYMLRKPLCEYNRP